MKSTYLRGAAALAGASAIAGAIAMTSCAPTPVTAEKQGILQPAMFGSDPEVWTDPDTGCEYLARGVALVPRYSEHDGGKVRGCGSRK